jgi:hypothetical protein
MLLLRSLSGVGEFVGLAPWPGCGRASAGEGSPVLDRAIIPTSGTEQMHEGGVNVSHVLVALLPFSPFFFCFISSLHVIFATSI